MVAGRLERIHSGVDCSCSPHSAGLRPANRPSLRPRKKASSIPARNASTLEYAEEILEPESELLSRDLLEEKFSGKQGSQISRLQALEQLKGDMRSALIELEEPIHGFSVGQPFSKGQRVLYQDSCLTGTYLRDLSLNCAFN